VSWQALQDRIKASIGFFPDVLEDLKRLQSPRRGTVSGVQLQGEESEEGASVAPLEDNEVKVEVDAEPLANLWAVGGAQQAAAGDAGAGLRGLCEKLNSAHPLAGVNFGQYTSDSDSEEEKAFGSDPDGREENEAVEATITIVLNKYRDNEGANDRCN
jgi:hypothetical protein